MRIRWLGWAGVETEAQGERVVTASAGNHGRAVAHAARVRGVPCEVFMPRDASVSKVAAVQRLGARIELEGASVEQALQLAAQRGAQLPCGRSGHRPRDEAR